MKAPSNLTGIAYMVLANLALTVNNALVKLAVLHLPPLETMFLRAVAAVLLGLPVLALTASLGSLRHVLDRRVLTRSLVECGASIAFVFAVATAPLADLTAILQLTPVFVLLGAVVFFGDRVGWGAYALVALALLGAVLVAQPGGAGLQPYILLGLLSALLSAGRDLLGRRVHSGVPALAVAVAVSAVSVVGMGVPMLVLGQWVAPSAGELLLIVGAAALLTLAQLLLFLAFRVAETRAVLPFFYTGTLWALVLGALIFGTLPNATGFAGIGMILVSGIAVVIAERRASR
ncbi:DMT family transporter [Devosia sp. CN2-171]|uniref:DMT family transporter n=1 Tax=Devosia sp. CN2-171 TaxID=3400909 RepID=UPI003BF8E168